MLKNKKSYWYYDEHLYFYFNNVYSKRYNLFIENGGEDLKVVNTSSPSSQYSSPDYQYYTYYLGTTLQQRTFKYKVAAEGLTQETFKEMMQWLHEGAHGFLVVDSNWYWGYDVVLETVGDSTMLYNNSTIVTEFELTFKTYASPLARGYYNTHYVLNKNSTIYYLAQSNIWDDTAISLLEQTALNEFGIPEIVHTTVTTENNNAQNNIYTLCLPQVSNEYSYLNLTAIPTDADKISQGEFILTEKPFFGQDKIWTQLTWTTAIKINSIQYFGNHNCVLVNNTFPELQDINLNTNEQDNALCLLYNQRPLRLPVPTQLDGEFSFVVPYSYGNYFANGRVYIAYTEYDKTVNYNIWNVNPWKLTTNAKEDGVPGLDGDDLDNAYPIPYHCWIVFNEAIDAVPTQKPFLNSPIICEELEPTDPLYKTHLRIKMQEDALWKSSSRPKPEQFIGTFYIGYYHKMELRTNLQNISVYCTKYNNL